MGNKLGTSGNTMKTFYPPHLTSYQTSHLFHENTNCVCNVQVRKNKPGFSLQKQLLLRHVLLSEETDQSWPCLQYSQIQLSQTSRKNGKIIHTFYLTTVYKLWLSELQT